MQSPKKVEKKGGLLEKPPQLSNRSRIRRQKEVFINQPPKKIVTASVTQSDDVQVQPNVVKTL